MERTEGIYGSKRREYALVLVFFFLAAALFTWPLILHVHDGVVGGRGDPLLNTWVITWDARAIFTHPTRLFQGNVIYPSRDVLAYSEHQFVLGLIAAPVYFLSRNPILAYNFLIFFGFVFSAFGCYLLVKELTGSRWGGLVGGIFYAFCFYKISRFSHIQILFSPFLPFVLLYLYRYLERGRKRSLFLFGVFFVAQSLTGWHHLMYCAIAAGLLWLWAAAFSRRKVEWMRLAWVAVAVAIAALVILPFALPYLRAHRRLPGFERSLKEVELYGAKGEDYLRVLDVSVVYGDAPAPFREGGIGYENVLYPGVVILLLAAAGLLLRRRAGEEDQLVHDAASFRKGALFFLVLGTLCALLAFGPKIAGRENPFYMIPYRLGLLKFTRVPTRFHVLVTLALAVLGGYGAAKLALRSTLGREGGWSVGRLTGAALAALLLFEILTFNLHVYNVPVYGEVPEVYDWLEEQGDVRVIELPTNQLGEAVTYDRDLKLNPLDIFEHLARESDIMYFSTYHWKQVVNGYSGYSPFFYRRILTEMQGFPSRRSIDLLRGLRVDYVIWDWDWVPSERMEEYNVRLFSTPGLAHAGDFGRRSVFQVEAGETASPEEMAVEAVAPGAVPPGEGFGMGLLVSNHTARPMVCVEEEPQPFALTFRDGEGKVAAETKGYYRPPFFVDAGETISVPLLLEGAPAAGAYAAELHLEGGVLGTRDFRLDMQAREMPDSTASGGLAGETIPGEEALRIPTPDGLYPLMVATVKNTGDVLWKALPQLEDYSLPAGAVHLGLRWWGADGIPWESQACSLPCDVAPGQAVEVPLLVRPPAVPGTYRLDLGLYREGSGWCGEVLRLEVVVEGWMGEGWMGE